MRRKQGLSRRDLHITQVKSRGPKTWPYAYLAVDVHTAKPTWQRCLAFVETGFAICIGFSQIQPNASHPQRCKEPRRERTGRRLCVCHRTRRRSVRRPECVHARVLWSGGGRWISAQHLRGDLIHGRGGDVASPVEIDDRVSLGSSIIISPPYRACRHCSCPARASQRRSGTEPSRPAHRCFRRKERWTDREGG